MRMQDHLAIPVLYASSWLLTAFASDFPIFFASRVMDIILTDRYMVAIMKVCYHFFAEMHILLDVSMQWVLLRVKICSENSTDADGLVRASSILKSCVP